MLPLCTISCYLERIFFAIRARGKWPGMKNSGSQGAAFAQLNDYGQAAGLLIGKLSDHGNILCAVQHGSHSTEVATEHLKCGRFG